MFRNLLFVFKTGGFLLKVAFTDYCSDFGSLFIDFPILAILSRLPKSLALLPAESY
jgi:hypothetical protein